MNIISLVRNAFRDREKEATPEVNPALYACLRQVLPKLVPNLSQADQNTITERVIGAVDRYFHDVECVDFHSFMDPALKGIAALSDSDRETIYLVTGDYVERAMFAALERNEPKSHHPPRHASARPGRWFWPFGSRKAS